jgi:hypothetical protein
LKKETDPFKRAVLDGRQLALKVDIHYNGGFNFGYLSHFYRFRQTLSTVSRVPQSESCLYWQFHPVLLLTVVL